MKKWILFSILTHFSLGYAIFDPVPHAVIANNAIKYSFIKSVDFHPKELLFCATYINNNQIRLYRINNEIQPTLVQTIEGFRSRLKNPETAVFSPDGQTLIAVNWKDRSLNVYSRKSDGLFRTKPSQTVFLPQELNQANPHGMAFSPSGRYLAITSGSSSDLEKGLVIFEKIKQQLAPVDILTQDQLLGIPKGICFSPDGTCILVTFCEPCYIGVFDFNRGKIDPMPKQIIEGASTGLSRPEDIKIYPDASCCAVSNSDKSTITFYHFDKNTNTITDICPFWSLANPMARLAFPHGLAFSSDGSYLAIAQFGNVEQTSEGKVVRPNKFPPQEGAVHIYRKLLPMGN